MPYYPKKCGVKFDPPAVVLIYEDQDSHKMRQRIIPIRNFTKFSECNSAAEHLKNNPRHKEYLKGISIKQLEKMYMLLRGHLKGQSISECLAIIKKESTIDPEEDLNNLGDQELAKKKSIMDELFEKNCRKKDDPDFIYDLEVEFPQDKQVESSGWDDDVSEGGF